jgi:hypothetical protein
MKDSEERDILEKVMKRNNQINLAILGVFVTFVVLMFSFMMSNNKDHTKLMNGMTQEQEYTHNVYKYVIEPNDSLTKILIVKNRNHDVQFHKTDSILIMHNKRLYSLEEWRKKNSK